MTTVASVFRPKGACLAGAAVLLLAAAFLPVDALVDVLGRHFNTARGFRSDFIRGLHSLRMACAVLALVLGVLPLLLARITFSPPGALGIPREDRFQILALYGIAMLLAAPGMTESFQDDEWRTLEQYVRHGPLVITTRSDADNHVLYSLLAWPGVRLAGMTEPAIRLPAFLLGPLAPALLYLLLRREHGRRASFLSALPMAATPLLTIYSHEGRAYGPLFSAILGLRLLLPAALTGSRRAWLGYVALGIATVYLHIYASAAVAGLAAGALLLPAGRTPEGRARLASSFLLIAGISLFLYAPLLPKMLDYSERMRALGYFHGDIPRLAGEAFVYTLPAWASIPFLLVLGAGLVSGRRPTSDGLAFIGTAALLAVLTSMPGSEYNARLFVPAVALGWLCLSDHLARRVGRGASGIALVGLIVALTATAEANCLRLGRRNYREASRRMEQLRRPGESYAALFDCRPMTAYLREPPQILTPEATIEAAPVWFSAVDDNIRFVPELEAWLARGYRVEFRLPSSRGELRVYRRL
jgi:hypothetical protein